MKLLPLISVIVPIYNVEQYLRRCIESIIKQTYQNLEIILIDDGSPDSCGKICDEYASIDKRIRVIHQPNKGLSAARNSGLDICKGEFIGFVDSDDFIHPEMYYRLYNDIITHHVKLAFCQTNKIYNETINKIELSQPTLYKTKEEVILYSMTKSMWWAAWTKLYHRSLFDHIRYPHGKTNEDYAVTIFIYDQCENIAINLNKLYYYCIRDNSICTSPLNNKKFDQIDNTLEVVEYMKKKHPEWMDAAEYVFLTTLLKLLACIHNDNSHLFENQKEMILKLITSNKKAIIKNKYLLWKQKMMLLTAYIHPVFFKWINFLYNHKQRF